MKKEFNCGLPDNVTTLCRAMNCSRCTKKRSEMKYAEDEGLGYLYGDNGEKTPIKLSAKGMEELNDINERYKLDEIDDSIVASTPIEDIRRWQAQGCPCCGDQIDDEGNCISNCGEEE